MDSLTAIISNYFPAFGLFVSVLLGLSALLDRGVRPELKEQLFITLYAPQRPHGSVLGQTPVYYEIVSDLFGLARFGKFVFRSFLITLCLLTLLITAQGIVSKNDFFQITLPFLKQMGRPDGRFILIALSVFLIDIISIYQTVTFLRISRGCNNIFEFIFVAVADFLLSITLFILLFPFFVTFAFFQNPPTKSVHLILSSAPTEQGRLTAAEIATMLVFSPPMRAPSDRVKEVEEQIERKWFFRTFSVSIYNGTAGSPSLRDAVFNSNKSGELTVQTRGNISDTEVVEVVTNVLRKFPAVRKLKSLEKSEGFFSTATLLEAEAESDVEYRHFWKTYFGVLKQINFLDEQFFRIVTLRSPSVSQNVVMFQYNMAASISDFLNESRTQFVYCDGGLSEFIRNRSQKLESRFDSCQKGIAVDSLALKNMLGLTRYETGVVTSVPISPLALSSLTATFVIYYILISRLVFIYAGALVGRLVAQGDQMLRRHVFFLTSVLVILSSVPIFLIIYEAR